MSALVISYESVSRLIREISEHFKTQKMCNEVVALFPYTLWCVPDHLKTQEMCDEAVHNNPAVFFLVPDCFKAQEMCIKALEVDPWQLKDIPDYLKTQKMCDQAVKDYLSSLQVLPDWFVTQQQIDVWYDDDYWYNNYSIFKWYEGYQKRKAQKAKIKEDFLPTAWHLDRVMDWCMSGDGKRLWK